MTKVFVSYSHDSEEHREQVLALANRLLNDGLDCILDQYVPSPPEGWPKWMVKHLKEADYVLVICTKRYYTRIMDDNITGQSKGVKWESLLVYNDIYYDDSQNTRFIPVVFIFLIASALLWFNGPDRVERRVVDEQGNPVAEAIVSIQETSVKTNENGWFYIDLPKENKAQEYSLFIEKKGSRTKRLMVYPEQDQTGLKGIPLEKE
jgi:SEFIR domain